MHNQQRITPASAAQRAHRPRRCVRSVLWRADTALRALSRRATGRFPEGWPSAGNASHLKVHNTL
ncbi:hypothetical protein XMIN_2110 [Xanthomonas citri pv. mangiferaeindicae LMG 941]|nr:hypothetical protein XMIN_2110 [Xanthomonas citri pv. mangiferaeindicae LMG 941]